MTPCDEPERARIYATLAGTAHAKAHGRDDWNEDDLRVAENARKIFLMAQPVPENAR